MKAFFTPDIEQPFLCCDKSDALFSENELDLEGRVGIETYLSADDMSEEEPDNS